MINHQIGENIRKWRQFRGYQQPGLAEKINVSVVSLSKWENGRVDISVSKLMMIAQVLDISIDDLLYSSSAVANFNNAA